jgi:protein-disulfide isomerase
VSLLALLMLPAALAGEVPAGAASVATVGDHPITLEAVDARCGIPCIRLKKEILARKWAALDVLVGDALLEGKPPEEPSAVSSAEVDAYLTAHRQDFHGPPERDRAAVRFFLERERRRETRATRLKEEWARWPPRLNVEPQDPVLADSNPDVALAVVGDRVIHNRDVETRLALALYRLRGQLQRERRRHLDRLIDEKLWNGEARARGRPVEALRAEVRSRAQPVTDADIDRHFEDDVRSRDPSAEKRSDRLRPYLEFRAAQAAEDTFLAALRARRGVTVTMAEPSPPRLRLDPGAGGWLGSPGAPVKIVFLTSYRGATSRAMWAVARALAAEPGAALAVRPLLPQWDPEASTVAAAVRCAAESGKHWELHDDVAGAPTLPDRAELDRLAASLALDPTAFGACMARPATLADVAAASEEAERLGLDEPPAVLINGLVRGGMQTLERLRTLVAQERTASAGTGSSGTPRELTTGAAARQQ